MADYPANLPCANWQYAQNLEPFQNRTPYDCGWVRQRKRFNSNLTGLQLSFTMDTATFNQWTDWMDVNGYVWFNIDLDDYGAGKETTSVRLTSGVQYSYNAYNIISVNVSAEVQQ